MLTRPPREAARLEIRPKGNDFVVASGKPIVFRANTFIIVELLSSSSPFSHPSASKALVITACSHIAIYCPLGEVWIQIVLLMRGQLASSAGEGSTPSFTEN